MDIVTSLGADEEKIILAGSAMGQKFNLLDVSRNTPGSAIVGKPTDLTYQQVIYIESKQFPKFTQPPILNRRYARP